MGRISGFPADEISSSLIRGISLYKLYAIFSKTSITNMKGNRGRMTSQAGHAFLHSWWDAAKRFPDDAMAYQLQNSSFKITLLVDEEEDLRNIASHYHDLCGVTLVEERGTKVDGGINEKVIGLTCVGIGPIHVDKVGDKLSTLKLLL